VTSKVCLGMEWNGISTHAFATAHAFTTIRYHTLIPTHMHTHHTRTPTTEESGGRSRNEAALVLICLACSAFKDPRTAVLLVETGFIPALQALSSCPQLGDDVKKRAQRCLLAAMAASGYVRERVLESLVALSGGVGALSIAVGQDPVVSNTAAFTSSSSSKSKSRSNNHDDESEEDENEAEDEGAAVDDSADVGADWPWSRISAKFDRAERRAFKQEDAEFTEAEFVQLERGLVEVIVELIRFGIIASVIFSVPPLYFSPFFITVR
jgi:hypothetical protein